MNNFNPNIDKVCSFYVSDWHLITMLLPNVNNSINKGIKITTIFEEDESEKVKTLVGKLNLKNERQILRINWKNTYNLIDKIEEILKSNIEDKIEIIISGSLDYIKKANDLISQYVEKNNVSFEIKLINCYSVEDKINMQEILDEHSAILNTAGEKSKQEYVAK